MYGHFVGTCCFEDRTDGLVTYTPGGDMRHQKRWYRLMHRILEDGKSNQYEDHITRCEVLCCHLHPRAFKKRNRQRAGLRTEI